VDGDGGLRVAEIIFS